MKKENHFITAIVLALLIALSSVNSFAEDNQVSDKELYIEVIDAYIELREQSLAGREYNEKDACALDHIVQNVCERADVMDRLRAEAEISFTQVETAYCLQSIQLEGEAVRVLLYEWNDIEYNCKNSLKPEKMGFGAEHELLLKNINGRVTIIEDLYDESGTTGICTIKKVDLGERGSGHIVEKEVGKREVQTITPVNCFYPGYNKSNAILYAHTWCGRVSVGYNSDMHTGNNNPAFYYCMNAATGQGVDCANFVSQCLLAGGVSETTSWYHNAPNPIPSVPINGGTGTTAGTLAWVSVTDFHNYWVNYGITHWTGMSHIMSGNPVYWKNESGGYPNHLMICTGFNSSGVPLVDAHNGDAMYYPVNMIAGNKTLHTLTFYCDHSWSYNTSVHLYYCSKCCSYSQNGPY